MSKNFKEKCADLLKDGTDYIQSGVLEQTISIQQLEEEQISGADRYEKQQQVLEAIPNDASFQLFDHFEYTNDECFYNSISLLFDNIQNKKDFNAKKIRQIITQHICNNTDLYQKRLQEDTFIQEKNINDYIQDQQLSLQFPRILTYQACAAALKINLIVIKFKETASFEDVQSRSEQALDKKKLLYDESVEIYNFPDPSGEVNLSNIFILWGYDQYVQPYQIIQQIEKEPDFEEDPEKLTEYNNLKQRIIYSIGSGLIFEIPSDFVLISGNCFYDSIAYLFIKERKQHYDSQKLRKKVAQHIQQNRNLYSHRFVKEYKTSDGNLNDYISTIKETSQPADQMIIQACAAVLKINLIIISLNESVSDSKYDRITGEYLRLDFNTTASEYQIKSFPNPKLKSTELLNSSNIFLLQQKGSDYKPYCYIQEIPTSEEGKKNLDMNKKSKKRKKMSEILNERKQQMVSAIPDESNWRLVDGFDCYVDACLCESIAYLLNNEKGITENAEDLRNRAIRSIYHNAGSNSKSNVSDYIADNLSLKVSDQQQIQACVVDFKINVIVIQFSEKYNKDELQGFNQIKGSIVKRKYDPSSNIQVFKFPNSSDEINISDIFLLWRYNTHYQPYQQIRDSPKKEDNASAAEKDQPEEDKSTPAAEEDQPEEDKSTPAEEEDQPEENKSAPVEEEDQPEEDKSTPAAEEDQPEEDFDYDDNSQIQRFIQKSHVLNSVPYNTIYQIPQNFDYQNGNCFYNSIATLQGKSSGSREVAKEYRLKIGGHIERNRALYEKRLKASYDTQTSNLKRFKNLDDYINRLKNTSEYVDELGVIACASALKINLIIINIRDYFTQLKSGRTIYRNIDENMQTVCNRITGQDIREPFENTRSLFYAIAYPYSGLKYDKDVDISNIYVLWEHASHYQPYERVQTSDK